mgnify:CR=1 FL=1|jgi:hypothetical protein
MKTPIIESLSKVRAGHTIIGEWSDNIDSILVGEVDEDLRCAFFFSKNQVLADSAEQLHTLDIDRALEHFKSQIQAYKAESIKKNIEREAIEKEQATAAAFLAMNKPDPVGSVKDLAAHYGVSISQYRKLKRDGRLNELIAVHS